jgi:hypothetical protein
MSIRHPKNKVGFLAISSCIIFHVKHYKEILGRYFTSRDCAFSVTGGMCLCLGVIFEKSHG